MATGQTSEVTQHLRKVLLRDGAGLTDGQLLADFLRRRDEAALAALVHRHSPMVWGVCRRVLHNHHDAEDAFQATFLVLVRKAGSIAAPQLLANWLYGVAHQTALKARVTTGKRRARERQVTEMSEPAATEQDLWHHLLPLLDQELSRLPDKYRIAIVLCDLEGKTRKDAARQLGVPEGTLAARVSRGRALLAKRLGRHGLTVSGVSLAVGLAQNAASLSAPAAVVSSTITAAALFAAGQAAVGGAVSAEAITLTEGVLKSMLLTKLKIATTMLLTAALVCSGVGLLCDTLAGAAQAEPAQKAPGDGTTDAPKKEAPREDAPKEAERQKAREAAKLQGTWKAVAAEVAGQALPENTARTNVWEIADGTITTKRPNSKEGIEQEVRAFRIDPARKPAHIDIEGEVAGVKTVTEGIYKLDGDELTVCLIGANGGRPTEFSSSDLANGEKGGNILMKFKRERKEDAPKKGDTEPPSPPQLSKGTRAFTLKFSQDQGLPEGILPGVAVDVAAEVSEPIKTGIAVLNVKVLAIDTKAGGDRMVTVELTPTQVTVLALVEKDGTKLSITLHGKEKLLPKR
jgi:RNA polymerase sigma factor (sigma-70 family)